MNPPPRAKSLASQVVGTLFRQKGVVIGLFVVTTLVVLLYTFLTPKYYQSQAKLFIRLGRENVALDPTSTLGQGPALAVPNSREEELNSVIEILQSQVLLESVVDAIGPEVILGQQPYDPGAQKEETPVPASSTKKPGAEKHSPS